MKRVEFALVVGLLALVSGCDDQRSPEGVVRSAGSALYQKDFPRWLGYLSTEGRTKHGNVRTFEGLVKFMPPKNTAWKIVTTGLLKTPQGRDAWTRDFLVEASSVQPRKSLKLGVRCQYERRHRPLAYFAVHSECLITSIR